MSARLLDAKGMKCPLPTLRMLTLVREMQPGEILEVVADCPTFEADVRKFCETTGKALLFVKVEGACKRVQVRV